MSANRTHRLDDSDRLATSLACIACDYNLRTLSHSEKCPECGVPVARSLPLKIKPSFIDSAGLLAVSLLCVHCGYNLRGIRADGVCPECATPLSSSLQSLPLQLAPAEWLRQVARGVRAMQISAIVTVVAVLILVLLGVPDAWWRGSWDWVNSALGLCLLSAILLVIGAGEVSGQREGHMTKDAIAAAKGLGGVVIATIVAAVGSLAYFFLAIEFALLGGVVAIFMLMMTWTQAAAYIGRHCSLNASIGVQFEHALVLAFLSSCASAVATLILTFVAAWDGATPFESTGLAIVIAIAAFFVAFFLVTMLEIACVLHTAARDLRRIASAAQLREETDDEPAK